MVDAERSRSGGWLDAISCTDIVLSRSLQSCKLRGSAPHRRPGKSLLSWLLLDRRSSGQAVQHCLLVVVVVASVPLE